MPKPQGIISAQEAQTLNDNWTNLRAKANEAAVGQPDNRSSWYSLDDMQNFLDYIKENSDNVNGVRFYLGVEITKEDLKGMTTIFMVPTEEKDGKNIDIEGAEGMDRGLRGDPPPANYPQ
ncbi:hypothetical protein [Mesoflavibacter sp. CH_XMU1422-2]|uniref:hypothetical protein n=1 Tax=Mesoflavibacter sp. CH_XMU1422-2 TaxID=3107770 RepID=UPI00300AD263